MNLRRSTNGSTLSPIAIEPRPQEPRAVLGEELFQRMISLERKRSERSRKPFLLMIVDMGDQQRTSERVTKALTSILTGVSEGTRETDVVGWFKTGHSVGVMFTEISIEDRAAILGTMITRVSDTLKGTLSSEQFSQVNLSFHLFPEDWQDGEQRMPPNSALYPDLEKREESRRVFNAVKRAMDIGGSLLALAVLSPLFLAIALAVKLSSQGPIFFRQKRIGRHGMPFVFLKFRSMYTNNDAAKHKEFVRRLIVNSSEPGLKDENGEVIYKMTADPRITKIGSFLRRTSLDELPQFINVLKGEMSLVGPRPPIPYEVEAYDFWHRGRVLEARPGITGLWQVTGRSRVKFDDMVRLDLQYARTWSPWMDLKILLRTPGAVVLGEGAH